MGSEVFEKPVNFRIVHHLEKCSLFSDFQDGFRSSQSTSDLLTVVSDRIARSFNKSGATHAVAPDISKALDRVWHADLLHKLNSQKNICGMSSTRSKRSIPYVFQFSLPGDLQTRV